MDKSVLKIQAALIMTALLNKAPDLDIHMNVQVINKSTTI